MSITFTELERIRLICIDYLGRPTTFDSLFIDHHHHHHQARPSDFAKQKRRPSSIDLSKTSNTQKPWTGSLPPPGRNFPGLSLTKIELIYHSAGPWLLALTLHVKCIPISSCCVTQNHSWKRRRRGKWISGCPAHVINDRTGKRERETSPGPLMND